MALALYLSPEGQLLSSFHSHLFVSRSVRWRWGRQWSLQTTRLLLSTVLNFLHSYTGFCLLSCWSPSWASVFSNSPHDAVVWTTWLGVCLQGPCQDGCCKRRLQEADLSSTACGLLILLSAFGFLVCKMETITVFISGAHRSEDKIRQVILCTLTGTQLKQKASNHKLFFLMSVRRKTVLQFSGSPEHSNMDYS